MALSEQKSTRSYGEEAGKMKKFNWENFKAIDNKIAVHCKNEEEAKDFCRKMHEQGMKWSTGGSYAIITNYDNYRENTCYSAKGVFGRRDFYESEGYKILDWSDYMKKEFTKADLESGMVVEYREKMIKRRIVIGNELIGEDGYNDLNMYTDELTAKNEKRLDIQKIYKIKSGTTFKYLLQDENLELIWEKKELKKMTVEEIKQKLEELIGERIEVI